MISCPSRRMGATQWQSNRLNDSTHLAMFYRRHQHLYRIGLFYCAAPLSGAIGGLLATGLSQIQTSGYDGGPFIFFIEGAITVVFAAIAMIFLPHTPGD